MLVEERVKMEELVLMALAAVSALFELGSDQTAACELENRRPADGRGLGCLDF